MGCIRIFRLLAEKWNGVNGQKLIQYDDKDGKPNHFEYLVFDKYLVLKLKEYKNSNNPNKDILDPVNEIWKEVKSINSILSEWYEDHTLYHYIGYLLAIGSINKEKFIKESLSIKITKTDFINYLKKKIANVIYITRKKDNSSDLKQLSELSYGIDDTEIRNILLLLNIEAIIKDKKENARFPFHLYKNEKITSIEHIHPQNPESIDTDDDRSKVWIESHKHTLKLLKPKGEEFEIKIQQFISGLENLSVNYNKEMFKTIYSHIIELYTKISQIKENEIHTLYNLALVDKDTNSSLNNSFFDIKRDILRENKLGRYIPTCTQRVFSKYYLSKPQEMIFWSDGDRKAYFGEIESMYKSFIKLK